MRCYIITYQNEQTGDNATSNAHDALYKSRLVAEHGKKRLFQHVRRAEGGSKGPPQDATSREPKDAVRGSETALPVHKRSSAEHAHVHGKARGQVRGGGVKVAGARDGRDEKEDADSGVERNTGDLVEENLAEGADKGQNVADKVKLGNLFIVILVSRGCSSRAWLVVDGKPCWNEATAGESCRRPSEALHRASCGSNSRASTPMSAGRSRATGNASAPSS